MPRDNLLAVAFTDLNGNDKYNPGKDALIAAIVDTNNDNGAVRNVVGICERDLQQREAI